MDETTSTFAGLPADFLYELLPHLPLKSLIAARGVCRAWRRAIDSDVTDIHPIRRALLDIYLETISAEWFVESREWPLQVLRPFDRQAYLDALLAQYNWLPEQFVMWILEWPACAAIGWEWPGLPDDDFNGKGSHHRLSGSNCLGTIPPVLGTVTLCQTFVDSAENSSASGSEWIDGLPDQRYNDEDVPAVLVFEDPANHQVWLLLAGGPYAGKVILSHEMDSIDLPPEKYGDWVGDWLQWMWRWLRLVNMFSRVNVSLSSLPTTTRTPRPPLDFKPWSGHNLDIKH